MVETRAEIVVPRSAAMALKSSQKGSSRLTLVLLPLITIERFTIEDGMVGTLLTGGGLGRARAYDQRQKGGEGSDSLPRLTSCQARADRESIAHHVVAYRRAAATAA